jgi:uncharacterized paraquat-inducible protein A
MTEKVSERAMGYGWRLFGIAFLLMLMYVIVWTYTFARYYVGLIHPQVKDVLPQLPDSVYRATFVLFWVGVFLVPVAVVIVLLSAVFELRVNYAVYKATMAELKKTSS